MPAAQPVTSAYCLKKSAAALRTAQSMAAGGDVGVAAACTQIAAGWRDLASMASHEHWEAWRFEQAQRQAAEIGEQVVVGATPRP